MSDQTRSIDELDLSTVDFDKAEWSWRYNAETQEGALLYTTTDADNSFSTITYPLPKCMVFIIDRIRTVALSGLKRELRALDEARDKLLS